LKRSPLSLMWCNEQLQMQHSIRKMPYRCSGLWAKDFNLKFVNPIYFFKFFGYKATGHWKIRIPNLNDHFKFFFGCLLESLFYLQKKPAFILMSFVWENLCV
jgi:hypothetical protein